MSPNHKNSFGRVFTTVILAVFAVREVKQLFSVSPLSVPGKVSEKSRDFNGWVLFLALSVLFGLVGGILYDLSNEGPPARPNLDDGGILIFVDKPNEQVTVNFIVNRSGSFALSVASKQLASFLVVASGAAQVEPAGDFRSAVSIRSVVSRRRDGGYYNGLATGSDFEDAKGYSLYVNGYDHSEHVTMAASLQYYGTETAFTGGWVAGKLRNPITSASGATEMGSLPLIGAPGTMAVSGQGASTQAGIKYVELGGAVSRIAPFRGPLVSPNTKWYVPRVKLNIAVTYSRGSPGDTVLDNLASPSLLAELPPNYELGSAAPSTTSSSQLQWEFNGYGEVAWSLTNLSRVRLDSGLLFAGGILLGLAGSMLGIALDRIIRKN